MRLHGKANLSKPGQALKDVILSDVFTKLVDRVDQNLSRLLANVKTLVEVVHYQNYSPALMQGKQFDNIHPNEVLNDRP